MGKVFRNIASILLLSTILYISSMLILCSIGPDSSKYIYYLANYIPLKGGQEMYMIADYDPSLEYDVLVLGSSHAYRGYDPRIFEDEGMSMFNAGSSAQSPELTHHLLDEYLNLHSNQLVLLDIFPLIFSNDGSETKLRWIVHDPNWSSAARLAIKSLDFRAINTLTKRTICEDDDVEYEIDGYTHNGYCSIADTLNFNHVFDESPFRPLGEICADFEQLISRIEEAGARLVLLNHPMPQSSFQPDMQQFLDSLDINTPYLDFTHSLNFGMKYFSDASHLNQAGVDKFNKILIQELRDKGYLQP